MIDFESFRERLVDEIAAWEAEHGPSAAGYRYYGLWLAALERTLAEEGLVEPTRVDAARQALRQAWAHDHTLMRRLRASSSPSCRHWLLPGRLAATASRARDAAGRRGRERGAGRSRRRASGRRRASRGTRLRGRRSLLEMRADERFRVGSVTKTFVAALVLLLVEDGKLRLDDTVESRLPG